MSIDIIVAPPSQFDEILQDVNNRSPLDVTRAADVSIDDVVTIVAIYRNAIDDRPAWWKIRREVNAHFATHTDIATRTLALIPDFFRDEIATFTKDDIDVLASRWFEHQDSSPKSLERANESLSALVNACQKASKQSTGVFLRTNQPPNAFEVAFSSLSGNQLSKYRRAFDKLDDRQKYEAHQKFNYYQKQGLENSLALVLRDLTRTGTKKLNLKTDQRAIQRHISQRVKEYCKTPCPTSGSPDSLITLIMLTFDIEYEGFIDFGFDTRENSIADIKWEEGTTGRLDFPHWNEGLQRLGVDELPLGMTLHDGTKTVISPGSGEDILDTYIGDMLRDTLVDARNTGTFAKLPLADVCYMLVGGTHTNYAWPADLQFDSESRANQPRG